MMSTLAFFKDTRLTTLLLRVSREMGGVNRGLQLALTAGWAPCREGEGIVGPGDGACDGWLLAPDPDCVGAHLP